MYFYTVVSAGGAISFGVVKKIKYSLKARTARLAISSRDPKARTAVLAFFVKTPNGSITEKARLKILVFLTLRRHLYAALL